MKRNELQKCAICDRGVMHAGIPFFFRMRVERMVVDMKAVQRRHGLEQFFGGTSAAAILAGAMGPDEDIAKTIAGPVDILVCESCATGDAPLSDIIHRVLEDDEEEDSE